jgi:hypothetical protein
VNIPKMEENEIKRDQRGAAEALNAHTIQNETPQTTENVETSPSSPETEEFDYSKWQPGIAFAVKLLCEAGIVVIEAFEGDGFHSLDWPWPLIIFRGNVSDARRVLEISRAAGLGACYLARIWRLSPQREMDGSLEFTDLLPDLTPKEDFVGDWEIQFIRKFPSGGPDDARYIARQNETLEQTQDRVGRLWDRMEALEPELKSMLERVRTGMIHVNDLWLVYFHHFLQGRIGGDRLADGDPLLFSEEAFEAALLVLFAESRRFRESLPPESGDHSEQRASATTGPDTRTTESC